MTSPKRVAITGGAGFLGSHLCEKLLDLGYEVLCIDNFFTGTKQNILHLLDNPLFEIIRHDVTFPLYLEVDEFNYVYFHFEDDVIYTTSNFYDEYNYPLQEVIDKRKSNEGFRFELANEDEVSRFRQEFVVKFIK